MDEAQQKMGPTFIFAKRVYLVAAIYGFIVLVPQYFLEASLVPPTTHPEQFYGFIGLALVWQFVFVMISRDVGRYRMLMPVTVLEKLAFGLPALILYLQGRVLAPVLAVGLIDLLLGMLFAIAFVTTRGNQNKMGTEPKLF
ncbi:MAG: hypothetical protein U1C96_07745 [Gallionella sp.]|nr:hypothetical protein [Gallionella sp.]